MVNRVILDGHCTRDTVRVATQGKPMARMRVATNSVWRDANGDRQETTEYHSIVLFGRTAEVAEQFAVKGRSVYVEGRLRTRDFTDGDGNRRFSTESVRGALRMPVGGGTAMSAYIVDRDTIDLLVAATLTLPGLGGRHGEPEFTWWIQSQRRRHRINRHGFHPGDDGPDRYTPDSLGRLLWDENVRTRTSMPSTCLPPGRTGCASCASTAVAARAATGTGRRTPAAAALAGSTAASWSRPDDRADHQPTSEDLPMPI